MSKKIFVLYYLIILILIGIIPIFSANAQTLCQQLAAAMDADAADGLTSCSFSGDSRAGTITTGALSNTLPTEGSTFAVLSTGKTSDIAGSPGDFISTDFGAVGTGGDTAILTLNFTIPATANCLSFDFEFLSEEYPEYVTSNFNDYFHALLNGVNISFDNVGNEITVNNNYFLGLTPPNAFDGATPRLTTTWDVTPGSNITLAFKIADVGDGIYDSAVFIDRLRIRFRKSGYCLPGTVYCTDSDDDAFYLEGGDCGTVDCNDNDWCINPGLFEGLKKETCNPGDEEYKFYLDYIDHGCDVEEFRASCNGGDFCQHLYGCGDGKDNDCDGKIDLAEEECPEFVFGGLVTCGRLMDDPNTEEFEFCPCRLCHLLILGDKIIDFALLYIVFPLAVLIVVIGGIMFLTAGGSPERIANARKLMTTVIIGVLIIFTAWIVINTFFTFIGVANWTGLQTGWWQVDCKVPGICDFQLCNGNPCYLKSELCP